MCAGQSMLGRPYEGPDMRAHMRFYFVFADNDVFSDPSWKPLDPLGGGWRPDRPFNSRCQICHRQPELGWKLVRSAIAGGMLSPLRRSGGVRRDRTDDLMLAKHALYQLSYDPPFRKAGCSWEHPRLRVVIDLSVRPRVTRSVVGPGGLEPPTSRLSGVCSNQLSYRP
jgi:hypothetical protein